LEVRVHKKPTPQFSFIAEKTLLVGLPTSTVFHSAKYTSHEIFIDPAARLVWKKPSRRIRPRKDGKSLSLLTLLAEVVAFLQGKSRRSMVAVTNRPTGQYP
jgi:hypothetical protein